jgi:hypothetical protein
VVVIVVQMAVVVGDRCCRRHLLLLLVPDLTGSLDPLAEINRYKETNNHFLKN